MKEFKKDIKIRFTPGIQAKTKHLRKSKALLKKLKGH